MQDSSNDASPGSADLNQVWSGVLTALRTRVPDGVLETWFLRTALLRLEEGQVTVGVPNTFHENWVARHYVSELSDSFQAILGERPELDFQVQPSLQPFTSLLVNTRPLTAPPESSNSFTTPPSGTSNQTELQLNRFYTFDNFVTGKCNEFAQAAAHGLVESPGRNYNPFFLYGSVGLGKTHLLQATCHALLEKAQGFRILYLSCETFINHFITALEEGNLNNFRHRYREADALVVDDIHLLGNKERTQEEFFHTFNVLYSAGKQIILSSDSPPAELQSFQERLISRFKWGMVASIDAPDYETRVAIIKRKARKHDVDMPGEICHYIADGIQRNIREIEGAVTKVVGFSRLAGRELNLELAEEAIQDFITPQTPSELPASDILQTVCERFGVRLPDLQSKKRTQTLVTPRQVAMYLIRELTPLSLDEIGSYLGNRDHSTVLYGIKTVNQKMAQNTSFQKTVLDIQDGLKKRT